MTSNWRRFHRFDPYTAEADRRAQARAEEMRQFHEQRRSSPFAADVPEVKQRREIRANQTVRAKSRPVSLPKVW